MTIERKIIMAMHCIWLITGNLASCRAVQNTARGELIAIIIIVIKPTTIVITIIAGAGRRAWPLRICKKEQRWFFAKMISPSLLSYHYRLSHYNCQHNSHHHCQARQLCQRGSWARRRHQDSSKRRRRVMENRVQELDWRWTQISELNFNGLAVWDLQYSLFGIFATQISLIHLRPFLLNLSYITTGVKSL